jgi:hypothetical protein
MDLQIKNDFGEKDKLNGKDCPNCDLEINENNFISDFHIIII